VDNDSTQRPQHPVLVNNKIVLKDDENLYVNAAWNWGVQNSKYNQICIMNDDIVVDLKLFFKMVYHIAPHVGVVGLCPGNEELNQPKFINGSIRIIPWNNYNTFGFGSLFFIHKSNWIPIPSELKIYYGDNWAFDTQVWLNRPNYIIMDCLHYSPWAATTGTINSAEWLGKEKAIYVAKFNEFVSTLDPNQRFKYNSARSIGEKNGKDLRIP
jgi:hypothetical protein